MRGIPNQPNPCSKCPSQQAAAKDNLCLCCRMRGRRNPRLRYPLPPEADARIRAAYGEARGKKELSAAITALARLWNMPRYIVTMRAGRLGLAVDRRRPWTPVELARLRDLAGHVPVREIQRKLKRSYASVSCQMERLQLSRRVREGYSKTEIMELFGVSHLTATRWEREGLIHFQSGGRCPEAVVQSFARKYPHEYAFRRVDEAWLKGLLFPSFGLRLSPRDDKQNA